MDQASCNQDDDDDILIVEEFNDRTAPSNREKHVVVLESSSDDDEPDDDDVVVIAENNKSRTARRSDGIEIFDVDEDDADDYDDDDIVIIGENSDSNNTAVGAWVNKQVSASVDVSNAIAGDAAAGGARRSDAAIDAAIAGTSGSGEPGYLNMPKLEPLLGDDFNFGHLLDMDVDDVKLPDFSGLSFTLASNDTYLPKEEWFDFFETIAITPENLKRRVAKCDLKVLLVLDEETQNLIKIALSAKNITLSDLLQQIKTDYYLDFLDGTRIALISDPTFGINYIIDIKPGDDRYWQKVAVTQELMMCVESSDLATIRGMLSKKLLPINIASYELMKSALRRGHSGVIKKLISHGAPVVADEDFGQDTLLHYAARLEDDSVAKMLLHFEAKLYAVNGRNETPIHVAAKMDNQKVLDKLLTHLVSLNKYRNIVDEDGLSIFHIVCMGQNSSYVVNFLANATISINDTLSRNCRQWPGYSALHLAVSYYRRETVQLLLQRGANLEARTAKGLSSFQLACKMDELKWMVRESVPHDLFDFFESDLKLVYFGKNLDRLLRSRGRIVDALIGADCDVDARDEAGNNALMNLVSVDISKSGIASWTKEKLAKENIKDFDDELTRWLLAARLESIGKILRHCADRWFLGDAVNSRNKFGFTCLHLTIRTNSEDSQAIFNLLLQNGADINARSKQLVTPLHVATVTNQHGFVSLLLHGSGEAAAKLAGMANVNAQDRNGNTPLHNKYSCIDWRGSVCNCVYSLLSFGTDIATENEHGSTMFSLLSGDVARMLSDELFELEVSDYDDTVDFGLDLKNDEFNRVVRRDRARSHRNDVIFVAELWKHFAKLRVCDHHGNPCTDHFLERVANKLHVNEKSILSRTKFIHDCEQEVAAMKAVRVSKCLSLSDVLCKHIDAVAACSTEDDALRNVLESPNFDEQFPMYERLLKGRYVRAVARSSLLKEASASLRSMTSLDLPDPCVRKILGYVNDKKLRDVAEADKLQCRVGSVIAPQPSASRQEPRQKMARIL